MLKTLLISLLPLFMFFGNGTDLLLAGLNQRSQDGNTGTLEKMIVANGSVTMDLDLQRLGSSRSGIKPGKRSTLQFDAVRDSFFSILVFNNELRGALPGSMELIGRGAAALPGRSGTSSQLLLEYQAFGAPYEMVVRDAKTGFAYFNVEGHTMEYNPTDHTLSILGGRLLLTNEYAADLGRASAAGTPVGQISIAAGMRTVEITQYVEGEAKSEEMPGMNTPSTGSTPGPDVIVGDLNGLAQFGSSGTKVGLAVGTDSCNAGTENLHWLALPNNDHPVIPQNLYRQSGGPTNDLRFEQIGQSNVKHAFTALTQNLCGFGCNGVGGPNLGSGCSDPYVASLNAGPSLGSRAWINPFTGFYPRGDSPTGSPNSHSGHSHDGTAHRIVVDASDLNPALNPGATYFAEAQYVTPHEYAWCQTHPGQCNMNNNVSYRKYNVSGTTSFSFSPSGSTVRSRPAITAWAGAQFSDVIPAPDADGVAMVAYKVTNPSAGVWHYEYAVYNENLDRAIQMFSVPVGTGVTNVGFHGPPQQPGWTFDGTLNNAGFSSAPWNQSQAGGSMTWSSETFAQNQNANAIRWGTLYNFWFDSNQPPQTASATVGFFKTGDPITVQVQAPSIPNASVSGRVLSTEGQGVRNAVVTISQSGGPSRTVATGSFGYYSFDNITAGGTYTISVVAKRYTFAPQTMQINGDLTNVNFVAAP